MTFIIHKEDGKHTYAYEVKSYWDKEKKSPRQKRRYLGKVDPETGKITRFKYAKPVGALDYGDVAFVSQCFSATGLEDILTRVYGDSVGKILKILSMSRVVNPVPMRRVGMWYDRTYLRDDNAVLSSQSISKVLSGIGEDDISLQKFFAEWIGDTNENLNLFYDITSMEGHSKLNEILEYGYSKSDANLPQINLGVVMNYETSLPLYYKIFPGSIKDVTTLSNLIVELNTLNLKKVLLVLDRGFYSQTNIIDLMREGMDFIIPIPFSTTLSTDLISKHSKDIDSPENARPYNKETLYVKEGDMSIAGEDVHYVLYYDKKRAADETNNFYTRLFGVEDVLQRKKIREDVNVDSLVKESAGKHKPYIEWGVEDKRMWVKRKAETISEMLERKGKTILVSSRKLPWDNMFDYYRSKNDVDMSFRVMKSDLEGLPLRTHGPETTKGYLQVIFLSTVLHSKIRSLLRESKLRMSLQDVLLELSKIRKIVLHDETTLTTEISKKQRDIIKALGIKYKT